MPQIKSKLCNFTKEKDRQAACYSNYIYTDGHVEFLRWRKAR